MKRSIAGILAATAALLTAGGAAQAATVTASHASYRFQSLPSLTPTRLALGGIGATSLPVVTATLTADGRPVDNQWIYLYKRESKTVNGRTVSYWAEVRREFARGTDRVIFTFGESPSFNGSYKAAFLGTLHLAPSSASFSIH